MSGTSRRRLAATVGIWVLVFASVVSWRQGVLYAGGVDPVVAGKAAVAVAALACAIVLRRTSRTPRAVGMWPAALVLLIAAFSLVGAAGDGAIVSNLVLVARIVLLAATVVLLVGSTSIEVLLATMLSGMAVVGLVAAASGLPHLLAASHGRLSGGIPQLAPNELATLLLAPAIGAVFLIVRSGIRPLPVIGLVVLTALIFATGSRTALLMLVVALLVQIVVVRRLTTGTIALLLVGALCTYLVLAFSSVLADVALRGQGTGQLLTLNSRTISWRVVLGTPPGTWDWWVGRGLAVKSVPVVGQYWSTQVFDSSWISSLAQDGVAGTVLLGVYVVGTVIGVARLGRVRALVAALVVTTLIRSVVENGLIESSATFAVFFALALVSWPGARAGRLPSASSPDREVGYPASYARQVHPSS